MSDLYMESRKALMVSYFCDKGTQQEQVVFNFAKYQSQ